MSIAVDLDGTLAHYDHWRGIEHIGAPVPKMLARVKEWIAKGEEVVIFTARITPHPDFETETEARLRDGIGHIQNWLEKQGLPRLRVTNIKDPGMSVFWDDRAVGVQPNTGNVNHYSELDPGMSVSWDDRMVGVPNSELLKLASSTKTRT
jgi:hypothetical protein